MWGEAPVTSVSGELQMTSALCHCHGAIVLKHSMRKHCQWAGCLGFIGDERPLPSCKIIFKLGLCSQPPEKTHQEEFFTTRAFSPWHKDPSWYFHNPEKLMERNDLRLNRGEDGLIASYTGQTGPGPWWNPMALPGLGGLFGWKMFSIYRRLQGGPPSSYTWSFFSPFCVKRK